MAADGFGSIGRVDHISMYKSSFGDLPDESMYSGPLEVGQTMPDMIKMMRDFHKAGNAGASSGAVGYTPMPLAYDPNVIDITRKFTPVKALIPKVSNQGLTANYYRLTARGAGAWGPEDPALDEADDTKELQSESMKYVRVTGRVTGVAEVGGAHFQSSLRSETMTKTQEINELIEEALLVGNNTNNTYQPDGLGQLLTSGNGATETAVSDEVTLSDVTALVNTCYNNKGAPNLIITDSFTAEDLKEQIQQHIRYVDPFKKVAWGLETLAINTVVGTLPVIVSQFMPTTSTERELYVLNTRFMEQRVLQDITFEKLAKTTDSTKFFLKCYMSLINKFPEGMGKLTTIT